MPSVQHQLLAHVVPRLRWTREVTDAERLRRETLAAQAGARTEPPGRPLRRCSVRDLPGHGFPVYDVQLSGAHPKRSVFYLHGGGYVAGADRNHWRFAARLAQRLEARVVLPLYPLAPRHSWRDSHDRMPRLFEQVAVESPQGVTVMGDSAGGGYALALAQGLGRRPGPQPTHLVLIAPWVDLTATAPGSAEAAARISGRRMARLRLFASWWAGDESDLRRPEVSPLFGDMTRLPPTLVYCGTHDALCPQVRALVARAREAGAEVTYHEEPGLMHVYPILPLPESARALDQLAAFL